MWIQRYNSWNGIITQWKFRSLNFFIFSQILRRNINTKKKKVDTHDILGLSTGNFLIVENGRKIIIYKVKGKQLEIIQTIDIDDNYIKCIIELRDKFLCFSFDRKVYIYSLNKDNPYSKKDELVMKLIDMSAIIQINHNKICISSRMKGTEFVSFYNLEEKQMYGAAKEVKYTLFGAKLSKNYVCFLDDDTVYLVNTKKLELVSKFQLDYTRDGYRNTVMDLCRLTSNKILIGDADKYLIQYKIENDRIIKVAEVRSIHYVTDGFRDIYHIIRLNDGRAAT